MKKTSIIAVLAALLAVGDFFYAKYMSQPMPETAVSASKLNIDAVCQGALAYMTFPDSASADVYVAECKEGKHPEVIEKYKADMHLGEGATI